MKRARLLICTLGVTVLLNGCSGTWVHPHKTKAEVNQDCRECEDAASRTSNYKAVYYDCMKAKNYQLEKSQAQQSLEITAIVISVLIGLSLGAG